MIVPPICPTILDNPDLTDEREFLSPSPILPKALPRTSFTLPKLFLTPDKIFDIPVSKLSTNDLIPGEIALIPFLIELPILANIPLSENVLGNAFTIALNPSAILGPILENAPPKAVIIPLNTPNF